MMYLLMAETDSFMPGVQDRFLLGIFYVIVQSGSFKVFLYSVCISWLGCDNFLGWNLQSMLFLIINGNEFT